MIKRFKYKGLQQLCELEREPETSAGDRARSRWLTRRLGREPGSALTADAGLSSLTTGQEHEQHHELTDDLRPL
jgi:hypothetical protein